MVKLFCNKMHIIMLKVYQKVIIIHKISHFQKHQSSIIDKLCSVLLFYILSVIKMDDYLVNRLYSENNSYKLNVCS